MAWRKLREESVRGWVFEYAKKTRLAEVLITENKLLRKFVTAKNKYIVKLIEAIANAENQELGSLNEDLNELQEENGVLMDHFKQIKQNLKAKQEEEAKVVEAYERVQRQKLEVVSKMQKSEDEEEHYSKMVTLLENSMEETGKREKRLQEEKRRLCKIRLEYENDHEQIEKEIDSCKMYPWFDA
jgi:chromosome segregation ATPase